MSTFSFIIQREELSTNTYVLRGIETLSDHSIEIQLRSDWADRTTLTAFVTRSSFPAIAAGTGVIVTRNRWEVTVEDFF